MTDRDSMSGWGDEKSAPMMVVAPNAGGGSGRMTTILLGGALVIALAIAGYSMYRVDADTRAHTKAVKELTDKHAAQVKTLEEKLVRSNAYLKEDLEYMAALEADNAAMGAGKKPTATPPGPPARQKYIDDLQRENAQRRDAKGKPVAKTPVPAGYDVWKSQ